MTLGAGNTEEGTGTAVRSRRPKKAPPSTVNRTCTCEKGIDPSYLDEVPSQSLDETGYRFVSFIEDELINE